MASRTIVTVTCDLPHTTGAGKNKRDVEVEGTETVEFSFDGGSWEIDVCTEHAKTLREAFSDYIVHGRRVKNAPPSRGGRRYSRSVAGREYSRDVREWAKQHGHKVSERGRIPQNILNEYQAQATRAPGLLNEYLNSR